MGRPRRGASRRDTILLALLLSGLLYGLLTGCGGPREDLRSLPGLGDGDWPGHAVCYGPHRDGQQPGGPEPSAAQLREDLHLMRPHWSLLRVYGAGAVTETLLTIIREEQLPLKVVLGAWIAPESPSENAREVAAAIRLANAFPGVVVAVSVGNETQVSWSAHRSPREDLIGHVREVRRQVNVPITVADDFNFWNKPESLPLAVELDFLTVHAHPMWNGLQLEAALPWVRAQLDSVAALHPDRPLVLGETGWATMVHDEGEQSELIKGVPGETGQKVYYDAVRAWAADTGRLVFFFEAFDEKWKGGPHPDEVEKHWGVFRADRTPKKAVAAR